MFDILIHAKFCDYEPKEDSVDSSSNSCLHKLTLPFPYYTKAPLFFNRSGGPWVSSPDESRPFGRSNPSASRLKSLPKAIVVMC